MCLCAAVLAGQENIYLTPAVMCCAVQARSCFQLSTDSISSTNTSPPMRPPLNAYGVICTAAPRAPPSSRTGTSAAPVPVVLCSSFSYVLQHFSGAFVLHPASGSTASAWHYAFGRALGLPSARCYLLPCCLQARLSEENRPMRLHPTLRPTTL